MNKKQITPEEIEGIDFLTQTDEQLEELSLRIANISQSDRQDIYLAIINSYFYGDISDFSKKEIAKMEKSEVDEQTRRKFINDKIHKVIDHKSIIDDYNKWSEDFLLKFPPLESE